MAAPEMAQQEAISLATPPSSPFITSLTRTTTPRDLPTMYHFDFRKCLLTYLLIEHIIIAYDISN